MKMFFFFFKHTLWLPIVLIFATANAQDVESRIGRMVRSANPEWDVKGPAKLIGSDIYESDFDKTESFTGKLYIDTPVSNVIRLRLPNGTRILRKSFLPVNRLYSV